MTRAADAGPSPDLAGAVLLLESATGYTCGALSAAEDADPQLPTPCAQWRLADLLAHMDDSLDTFVEAADGRLRPLPVPGGPRLASIRSKAGDLLTAWRAGPPEQVRLAGRSVPGSVVAGTAALEITVHGWDLHATLGPRQPVPEHLARALLPVARLLVHARDRGVRFAEPRACPPDATHGERLLAHVGRG